jgi:hypothetical protein
LLLFSSSLDTCNTSWKYTQGIQVAVKNNGATVDNHQVSMSINNRRHGQKIRAVVLANSQASSSHIEHQKHLSVLSSPQEVELGIRRNRAQDWFDLSKEPSTSTHTHAQYHHRSTRTPSVPPHTPSQTIIK